MRDDHFSGLIRDRDAVIWNSNFECGSNILLDNAGDGLIITRGGNTKMGATTRWQHVDQENRTRINVS